MSPAGHGDAGCCRACGAAVGPASYDVAGAPVHSVLNVRSSEEALAFPTGNIRLYACAACGYVQNGEFDGATQRFGPDYEETQGASARFRDFQRGLVGDLIGRHGLRGKRVLEIGCGKGDFLRLLCDLGDNEGWGFDPAWVPRGAGGGRARFSAEFYGPEHAGLRPDFVCCSMTLEHIGEPLRFLKMLRANLGTDSDAGIFFMVPDAMRIFRSGAFWDVYYEHCGYFARGSLARLLARAGFDVADIGLEFDGQYARVEARVATGDGRILCDGGERAEEIVAACGVFGAAAAEGIAGWRRRIGEIRARGRRVALWGGGSKAVAFLHALGEGHRVDAVVDINPRRQGSWLPRVAQRVEAPEALGALRPDLVIAMNAAYLTEIRSALGAMGLGSELVGLA